MPHPPLIINNPHDSQCKSQKHLGIILDSKLTFEDHYETILSKTNRTIGLLRKLQNLLPKEELITIYKAFIRHHLDYGDVLFDRAFKASSHDKSPANLFNLIPARNTHYSLRNSDNIPCFNTKQKNFQNFLSIDYNRMEKMRSQSAKMR